MNPIIKEAIKSLVDNMDNLNNSYNEEFGEDCPYKLDDESDKILREVVKDDKENEKK